MAAPDQPARERKPLWGFGPAGWALLLVAAALVWVLITGNDLRHQLLRLINETLGPGAVYWIVSRPLVGHWFAARSAEFNPIALTYVLVAMHVYPRRLRWWWYAALASGMIIAPAAAWVLPSSWRGTRTGPGLPVTMLATQLGANLAVIAVLCAMVRDRLIAAGLLAFFVLTATFHWWFWAVAGAASWSGYGAWFANNAATPTWHCLLASILLAWAVRERRRVSRPWECQVCRYDLRGVTAARCPECGAESNPALTAGP
jgi:hypothetical protein